MPEKCKSQEKGIALPLLFLYNNVNKINRNTEVFPWKSKKSASPARD